MMCTFSIRSNIEASYLVPF
uniref:Uncharacterized protein n=1 Tax=Anguilla anguilla TaxID=7936 RepID=A0A0E9R994_ANGAN